MTIYLKQNFNIHPASPETRDQFVEFAKASLLPTQQRLGGRLVAAWFNNETWFSQLTHVVEFPSLSAFEAFRTQASDDADWAACQKQIEELAPERDEALLEPLGPVPTERLDAAIEASADKPAGTYSFAILEVVPGGMEAFSGMLSAAAPNLPILASWRSVAGNPNQVIDLWSGAVANEGYAPTSEGLNAFFRPLRQLAPKERVVHLHPLPYSPLR